MQLIYDTLTGNTRRFAHKVADLSGHVAVDLASADPRQPYLLLTYTFGSGAVPQTTADFLAQHSAGLRGVVSSGSFHWGDGFGRAGDIISARYGVPLVARVNKSGSAADVQAVAEWLRSHRLSQEGTQAGIQAVSQEGRRGLSQEANAAD